MQKICIVDDTIDLLENIAFFLGLEGYEVAACKNGAEALKTLETFLPNLIITDLWMPHMNGYQLIKNINNIPSLRNIPIIVFSAAPLQAKELSDMNISVSGYIAKPANMESFLTSVQEILAANPG